MAEVDENQNFTDRKSEITKDFSSILSQHEALRRATLLKHRKVSTQLKLDMVQRQLSTLRRSAGDSDNDRQFYRLQMTELSNELQDLGSTLDKVERNAFYAKKRLMRHCGIDSFGGSSTGTIPLSSSNPAIYSSSDNLRRSTSRNSLKAKVCHLMASPTEKFKKKHFFGELRAVASLSSLSIKSNSPTGDDNDHLSKETKPWKAPLRFLGNLVDARFRRKLWGGPTSTPRTKSVDNIHEDHKKSDCCENKGIGNRLQVEIFSSSSSPSESEDEDDEEEWRTVKVVPRYAVKGPVMKKISSHQKAQVDPAVLAEIEDFERMAAKYIKQHS